MNIELFSYYIATALLIAVALFGIYAIVYKIFKKIRSVLNSKVAVITTIAIIFMMISIGYLLNRHIKTITNYSDNSASKTIWVGDLDRIKAIPNYTKKEGFELVWKKDYDKYQKGYCLQENRIYSDKEIYKRAMVQYFEKRLELYRKLSTYRFNCCYGEHDHLKPVGFYTLSGVDITNWYETLNTFDLTKESGLREMLFERFDAKPVDVSELLTIDMESMIAGFKKPIVQCNGLGEYFLYGNKTFFLYKEDDGLSFNVFKVSVLSPKREIYEHRKEFYENLGKKREKIKNGFLRKIDHCGNVDYDVEKIYLKRR